MIFHYPCDRWFRSSTLFRHPSSALLIRVAIVSSSRPQSVVRNKGGPEDAPVPALGGGHAHLHCIPPGRIFVSRSRSPTDVQCRLSMRWPSRRKAALYGGSQRSLTCTPGPQLPWSLLSRHGHSPAPGAVNIT